MHYASKERGGERISRLDSGYSGSRGGSLAPPSGPQRGVSPTPLGNLKLFQHPELTPGRTEKRDQNCWDVPSCGCEWSLVTSQYCSSHAARPPVLASGPLQTVIADNWQVFTKQSSQISLSLS